MSAPKFTPKSLSGLIAWLDGADLTSLTIATGVSQWSDKSGNGFHAVQATGSRQPLSGVKTINGRNALQFLGNANQTYMTLSGTLLANTVITVFRNDNTTFSDYDGIIVARSSLSTKVSNSAYASGYTGDSAGTAKLLTSLGQTSVLVYLDGLAQSAANFDNFAVGVSADPITNTHNLIVTDDNASAGAMFYCIGTDTFNALGFRHWDGDIGEIIIYNRGLTAGEIAAIYTKYLKPKWGLP